MGRPPIIISAAGKFGVDKYMNLKRLRTKFKWWLCPPDLKEVT
jgi:hypothetical protein